MTGPLWEAKLCSGLPQARIQQVLDQHVRRQAPWRKVAYMSEVAVDAVVNVSILVLEVTNDRDDKRLGQVIGKGFTG